ncbi:MAG: histidine phosphatase family protein [Clostridiaceae bacterium]|nr:histidine phosphatase family protein [Clostridiaceae bacterium]
MVTRLILVRHGEAEGNINRRFHGQTNSSLTPNGHLQAQKLAERLAKEKIDVLYSSDLSRAYDTAKYISKVKNLEIHKIQGLREINGGEWEDVPWDELPIRWPEAYYHWEHQPHLLQMPGGESMENFQRRVVTEIMKIVRENEGKNICVATHGTVIKALLCFFYGVSLEQFTKLKWHDNASITIVHIDEDRYTVVIEGDNMHLGELSTLAKQDWWKDKGKEEGK